MVEKTASNTARRCFIISPIGQEGSPIREHADAVYDFIIKPAMEQCDIKVYRSDHLREPGKISDQMYREILGDDLCIAVLTFHNPNVFYELAIAHAANRPTIIMLQKDETLPFDVKDMRCVYYDLKPHPLFNHVYTNDLVKHVKEIERMEWRIDSHFGDLIYEKLCSYGTYVKSDPVTFLADSSEYGTANQWLQLLEDTEIFFEIMGINLKSWGVTTNFPDVLKTKAQKGCAIRILLLHEDNPALSELINPKIPINLGIKDSIKKMYNGFSEIASKNENIQVRQIRHGYPMSRTVRTDQYAMSIPYFYSLKTADSPLLKCGPGASLYEKIKSEFNSLWDANPPE